MNFVIFDMSFSQSMNIYLAFCKFTQRLNHYFMNPSLLTPRPADPTRQLSLGGRRVRRPTCEIVVIVMDVRVSYSANPSVLLPYATVRSGHTPGLEVGVVCRGLDPVVRAKLELLPPELASAQPQVTSHLVRHDSYLVRSLPRGVLHQVVHYY